MPPRGRCSGAFFAGFQPNLSTVVWVGYPESNEIEMTSVHGISVFGGTFPADIWHAVYENGEIPCEEFEEPEKPIVWAPFYGRFTRGGTGGDSIEDAARGAAGELPGQEAVGGYDPNAYAPGVGQQPYKPPARPPPPTPEPEPAPAPSGGEGGGSAGIEAGEETP
jgi:membrane peptidoglycan carboxypeptidase